VAEKAEARLPPVAGQAVLRQAGVQLQQPVAVEVPHHLRPRPLGAVHRLLEEVQLRRPVAEVAHQLPRPPPQAVVKVAQLEPLPVGALPRRLAQVLPRPLPEDVVPQRLVEALLQLSARGGPEPRGGRGRNRDRNANDRGINIEVGPVIGRRYHGGVWYGQKRHFWRGRWYEYGVGQCWLETPIGFVWVCS
jgi:hypothetical protein